MAWKVGAAALASLLVAACGNTSRDQAQPATDAGADATDGEASPEVDPDLCRLQGYGIGPLEMAQCDPMHLMAHSAEACVSSGGDPTGRTEVSGDCETSALEVQVTCCYPDALPPVESVASPNIGGTFTLLLAAEGMSRSDLLLAADDACAEAEPGARLSDWIVYYAPDDVTPLGLRYYCFAAGR